jgi:formylglycine-generating enzyme required for sulfatase activity
MVLAALAAPERAEARRMLVALATAAGTRARRTAPELRGGGSAAAHAALDALVKGRLVVAGETCEIAHEALLRDWPRLRGWLDEASEARATAARLTASAREWDRLGRGVDGLWTPRQLESLDVQGGHSLPSSQSVDDVALAFIAASREAHRRMRRRRLATWLALPLAVIALGAGVAGASRWREQRATRAFVSAQIDHGQALSREAGRLDAEVEARRAEAFARFDVQDLAAGERLWSEALDLARRASDSYAAASAAFDQALARDPTSAIARARAADLAYLWLLLAERDHHPELARDLRARLALIDDDGSRRARLAAKARLHVKVSPPDAEVRLARFRIGDDGRRVADASRRVAPSAVIDLDAGSYLLTASAPGRYTTHFPVLLDRADDARIDLVLPADSGVPNGFAYVPAGTTRVGAAEDDDVRRAYFAQPEHAVDVGSFLVAVREVTVAEYLEFLAALSPTERDRRRPQAPGFVITFGPDGAPALKSAGGAHARPDEPICRPARHAHACRDWLRIPVAGVTADDGAAYARWLDATRVPGARLCTEREWERAARGADGRSFPAGDELAAGDANIDVTYGRDFAQMGPDEVGAYPTDASVFGVLDLAGNVAEWVAPAPGAAIDGPWASRGGYWYGDRVIAEAAHRFVLHFPRADSVGLRVCATAPRAP